MADFGPWSSQRSGRSLLSMSGMLYGCVADENVRSILHAVLVHKVIEMLK